MVLKKRCLLLFLFMAVSFSACENEKKESVSVERCDYTISKDEFLTKNSTKAVVAEISFEVPVFTSDEYKCVTDSMHKKREAFFVEREEIFESYVSEGEKSDYREGYFPYYCTSVVKGVYQLNGYCSVLTEFEWYAGGTSSLDLIPYNFSLENGKEITIDEMFQISEDELKEKIWMELKKQKIEYDDYAEEMINGYEMDDFQFYFDETGVYIVFLTGEISCTASGCISIPVKSFK